MRTRGMPRTCRFYKDGNNCEIEKIELAKEFPINRDGFLAPTPQRDAMGAKLAIRFKCYQPVYTGLER